MTEAAQLPFVSVVCPVRNEDRYIQRTLVAILAQDYPAERVEILVVDGLSDDGTREIVRAMSDALPASVPGIKLLDNPERIAPNAMNVAIARARGEVIIRVDGHCEIAPDYVSRCVTALDSHPEAGCVGGACETTGETWLSGAIAAALSSPFGVGSAYRRGRPRAGYVDQVPFGAYRRGIFQTIGGFDETLVRNQDAELNLRVIRSGAKVLYDPAIRSRYYSRSNLRKLCKQFYQYGRYRLRTMRMHGTIVSWRHLAPPLLAAGLVVTLAVTPVFAPAAVLVAGPYLLVILAASLHAAAKAGWRYLPALPLAFACTHLSWGAGVWSGVLRFGPPPLRIGLPEA